LRTYRHLAAKMGASKGGGKQYEFIVILTEAAIVFLNRFN
jgi:hypothetical protein